MRETDLYGVRGADAGRFSLLWPVLFGGLLIGSMVARLRGIRL